MIIDHPPLDYATATVYNIIMSHGNDMGNNHNSLSLSIIPQSYTIHAVTQKYRNTLTIRAEECFRGQTYYVGKTYKLRIYIIQM